MGAAGMGSGQGRLWAAAGGSKAGGNGGAWAGLGSCSRGSDDPGAAGARLTAVCRPCIRWCRPMGDGVYLGWESGRQGSDWDAVTACWSGRVGNLKGVPSSLQWGALWGVAVRCVAPRTSVGQWGSVPELSPQSFWFI